MKTWVFLLLTGVTLFTAWAVSPAPSGPPTARISFYVQ